MAPPTAAEDALVSNVDVFPTLCAAVGVPVPDWVHGSSLLPLVRGETPAVRDEAFSEMTYHAAYEPKRCVRTKRWTWIRRYDDHEAESGWDRDAGPVPRIPSQVSQGPTKDLLTDAGLYDRTLDPAERDNLAADPDHQDVRDELEWRLLDWIERTDDPLLDGTVPKPPGAATTNLRSTTFGPTARRSSTTASTSRS